MQTLLRRNPSKIFTLSLSLSRHFSTFSRSNFFNSSPQSTTETETGLYGFQLLKSPKGFQIFVDEAIKRSSQLVSFLSNSPPSMEIIRLMDEISDTVCSVVDSAELCRNTHPDKEFVEEATNAAIKINEHLHFLNTNHALYNAVLRTEQSGVTQTDEARRAAHSLRDDFEKGGIHLSAGSFS